MENQDFYYLIENQTLLITNRKLNAKAVITENDGETITGLFVEEKKHFFFNRFTCTVNEFDQIFSKVSVLKNKTPCFRKPLLCAAFFLKYGFSKPIRYWNEEWQQYSIYYKIEGYDCDIIVRPSTQVVPNNLNAYGDGIHEMPPEIQVDEFSDIKMLENHHINDFQVFVNSFENHIATFNYEFQMLDFMSICGSPLSCTQPAAF